jgi:PKHD-type hydroxylase
MVIEIPDLLGSDALARLQALLGRAKWSDGRITAGSQSAQVKRNQQLAEGTPELGEARSIVMAALERSPTFFSAALPARVVPPLFNRYAEGMGFGAHIDNAMRSLPGSAERVRTDVSCTLFLSDPDSYDGGELVIEDSYGEKRLKGRAGAIVVYPGTSLHRVEAVTRGERVASFFWVQSMVRGADDRRLLFDMDCAIASLRQQHGDTAALIALTGTYHNLLRRWADA